MKTANNKAGYLDISIPISKQLLKLALSGGYGKVRDFVEADAKACADQALHEALHYHSGFECGHIWKSERVSQFSGLGGDVYVILPPPNDEAS